MTSQTPDLAAVVERMEKLERELRVEKRRNRWLLVVVGLAAVGVVLAWTLANTTPTAQAQGAKVIRANQFVLEDENGMIRATLIASKDGPGLAMFDQNGKNRVQLDMDKDGPALVMRDENGKNRIGLAATTEGPSVTMFDQNGKGRIILAASPVGPALRMFDQNGKDRATLGVMDKGGSWLEMLDQNGKTIWSRP
jgi:hypothetical protein